MCQLQQRLIYTDIGENKGDIIPIKRDVHSPLTFNNVCDMIS